MGNQTTAADRPRLVEAPSRPPRERSCLIRCPASGCAALLSLLAVACNDDSSYRSPTAPDAPTVLPLAAWNGDYVGEVELVSIEGSDCGWNVRPGDSMGSLRMTVAFQGAITDRDITSEVPIPPSGSIAYQGSFNRNGFHAYGTGISSSEPCVLNESEVGGRFSAEPGTFAAEEWLSFGAPGAETVMIRRWTGRRL